jgi:hypothetical protein
LSQTAGWRASPWEPGSLSHLYKLLSQGLRCMNLILHLVLSSPPGVRQSSVYLAARHKLRPCISRAAKSTS